VKHAPATRHITRYDNRKLYEPAARRYVTVADVGAMVAAGDDVDVQDRKTGQDLTSQVLAQVLLDQLKERTASIPRQVLVRLVRLSARQGAWADWPHPQHAAERVRGEAERIAAGLLARGRLTLDEALSLRQEIAQSMQSAVGETQRALETRVRNLFERPGPDGGVNPALHALGEKLDTLEPDLAPAPGRTKKRPRAGAGRLARRT
jgi:polyhydroxyalkanoate synthesis repressor PhaR